jgi:protein tyrosine phosphatase (PTP) superfamily phosphohydrolase (DUF442 family)
VELSAFSCPTSGPPLPAPRQRRRWLATALLLVVFLALAVGGATWGLCDNFHTVIPGVVYRSGQLDARSLESRARRHHLRAVINLRGPNPEAAWYQEECATAGRLGLQHFDFPVDSLDPPGAAELADLLRLLQHCDKPVLIHCQSGIDRSGLVAAIAVLLLDKTGTVTAAHGQFALLYGHLPWRPSTARKKAFLRRYQAWLTSQGLVHDRDRFRSWALEVYAEGDEQR